MADALAIVSRYNFSFQAKLIQSDEEVQKWYARIRNQILAHKGVKVRDAWKHETYNIGRDAQAKILFRGKTVCVYLALDPKAYADTKYIFDDVSEKASSKDLPMMLRIKSERGAKWALELIDAMFAAKDVKCGEVSTEVEIYPNETTENLVARGLVKDNEAKK